MENPAKTILLSSVCKELTLRRAERRGPSCTGHAPRGAGELAVKTENQPRAACSLLMSGPHEEAESARSGDPLSGRAQRRRRPSKQRSRRLCLRACHQMNEHECVFAGAPTVTTGSRGIAAGDAQCPGPRRGREAGVRVGGSLRVHCRQHRFRQIRTFFCHEENLCV